MNQAVVLQFPVRPKQATELEAPKPKLKAFNRHLNRIRAGQMTEQEIISLRKFLNNNRTYAALNKSLIAALESNPSEISREQTEKGIRYLLKVTFRKDGTLRKTKTLPFGTRESTILKDFSHFEFVGVYSMTAYRGGYSSYPGYAPIYRVIANNGDSFEYAAEPMGEMVVLS